MTLSTARAAVRRLQRLVPARDTGTWILAYHLVDAGTASPVDVPLEDFRRQMELLRDRGRMVALDEALAALARGEDPRPAKVVLTFDDAYRNFLTHAWPVLRELSLPVTLYVPTDFVDRRGPPPIRGTEGLPAIEWPELRELAADRLMTVGSHTCSHPDLRRLPREAAVRELAGSKARLEDQLGVEVTSFAYPRALWSRRLEPWVGASYRSAVIAGGRRLSSRSFRPLRLSRLPVRRELGDELAGVVPAPVWLEELSAAAVRPWRSRWPR